MSRFPLFLAAVAAACVLGAAGGMGYWVLLHPANPLTAAFSGKVSVTDARVITGPYPLRADLEKLRAAGVETIVSLLDPAIPYEKALLEAERVTAGELGLTFYSFPMGSLLGHRFGEGYDRNAAAAADAIRKAPGKVYLHCYLGIHRISVVRGLIAGSGEGSTNYVRGGERTADAKSLDRAQALFEKGRFEEALAQLSAIKRPGAPALLLRGWCHYRAGRIVPAREAFTAALRADGSLIDARAGLGYCALREGNDMRALTEFSAVLETQPEDASALFGLGLTRKRQGRDADAAALFKRVLAKDPANHEAREALDALGVKP